MITFEIQKIWSKIAAYKKTLTEKKDHIKNAITHV